MPVRIGCNRGDDDDDGATPLGVPVNLAVTNGDGHYELTWDPVADATGYRVYEADTAGADPATLTPIESAAPPFSKTAVPNWVTKSYRVQAVAALKHRLGKSALDQLCGSYCRLTHRAPVSCAMRM